MWHVRFMRHVMILLALLSVPCPLSPAHAEGTALGRIAATVNDDVVTVADVNDRMALALLSSNLPNDETTRAKLTPQILRGLIDEALQRQQAKRNGISVTDDEVKAAIANMAKGNNIPPDQLAPFMEQHGVPMRTLRAQARAALLWSRVIQQQVRPLVEVGEEEVDARLEQVRANAGKPEYLVAEIFLRVDGSSDEQAALAFANQLVEQVKGGANFAALAQQFSAAAGAMQGGDLGWVTQGQLPRELDEALAALGGRGVTEPVKSAGGYHILLVRDTRTSAGVDAGALTVTLAQVQILAGDALDDKVAAARRAVKGCATLADDMKRVDSAITVKALPPRALGELPEWLAGLVQSLKTGEVSAPYALNSGALLVVLCDRKTDGAAGPSREAVTQQIGTERLELQAQRLLRDARNEAIVDIRQ